MASEKLKISFLVSPENEDPPTKESVPIASVVLPNEIGTERERETLQEKLQYHLTHPNLDPITNRYLCVWCQRPIKGKGNWVRHLQGHYRERYFQICLGNRNFSQLSNSENFVPENEQHSHPEDTNQKTKSRKLDASMKELFEPSFQFINCNYSPAPSSKHGNNTTCHS